MPGLPSEFNTHLTITQYEIPNECGRRKAEGRHGNNKQNMTRAINVDRTNK